MLINSFSFLCIMICCIFTVRRILPLNKIYKIGVLNLIFISIYIISNIYMITYELLHLPVLPYHIYINLIIALFLIFRVNTLNVIIDYNFTKNDKTFRYFNQNDKRWKNIEYGDYKGKTGNLGKCGCSLTVLAMICSHINKDITPVETAEYSRNYFVQNPKLGIGIAGNIYIDYAKTINLGSYFIDREDIIRFKDDLKTNRIICTSFAYRTPGGYGGHVILAYNIDENDNVIIADPSTSSNRKMKLDLLFKKVNAFPHRYLTPPFVSIELD